MILGVLGAIGAVVKDRDDNKSGSSSSSSSSSRASSSPEEIIQVSSDQLHRDYSSNEIRADEMYRGKTLVVTGAVQSINKDMFDDPYVVLWTTNEFEGVHATFKNSGGLGALSPGQHVTLRCKGDGKSIVSPMLKRCELQ